MAGEGDQEPQAQRDGIRHLSAALGRGLFERRQTLPTLVVGVIAQIVVLFGIDRLGSPSSSLGLPGGFAALIGVVAALMSGPVVGIVVALAGGVAYFVFITDFGTTVATPAILGSIVLWILAAGLAGLAGDWIRRRAAEREAALSRSLAERLRSEERLERSQRIAHLGSWELDLKRNELTWSDEVYRIFGLLPQEFAATYEAFLEHVHPADRVAVDTAYTDSIREGRDNYEIEHRVIREKTGEVRWVHERCFHVRDETGQIVRSIGMVHDITDRKRAEDELRKSEARQSFLLQLADALRPLADPIAVQETASRLLGEHLGVDRVAYAELVEENGVEFLNVERDYHAAGLEAHIGRQPLGIFGPVVTDALKAGRTVWSEDIETDPSTGENARTILRQLGVRAYVGAPLVKQRRLVGVLTALHGELSGEGREWSEEDLNLVEQTADRIWSAVQWTRAEAELNEQARLAAENNRINDLLSSSLEYSEILRLGLEEFVRALGAESGAILRREDETFQIADYVGFPEDIRGRSFGGSETPLGRRAETSREPVVVNDVDKTAPEDRELLRSFGIRSTIIIPLIVRDRVIGGLFANHNSRAVPFAPSQVNFARRVGNSISLAMENAQLFGQQKSIAATLQQALLRLPADVPGLRFSHLYRSATEAAAIGGDFYDLIPLQEDHCILLVGDVSGHGVEAARAATFVRDAIAVLASEDKDPEEILISTNNALLHQRVSAFVTLLLAIISPDRRLLSFCSAGHPHMVLRRHNGETTLAGVHHHPPLGVFPNWSCSVERLPLSPGDLLLFYTDGVIEARAGEELFGEERLLEWLRERTDIPLADLPSALLDDVLAFSGGLLQDDVAIMAVRIEA